MDRGSVARAALMLLAAAGVWPLAAQAPRDLSGRWVLFASGDTVPAATEAPSVPVAGPRESAPPGGSRQLPDRRRIGLLVGMAGAVRAFQFDQADSVITVANEDGFSYRLHPGGDEDRITILDSLTVTYRARWDGTFLEVEWRPETGGKLVERYQLADSGLFLRLDVAVEFQRFRQRESRLYRLAGAP